MDNKTLIHLQCESSTNREIRIPEESTIQCLKTVEDPKKRLVIVAHKNISTVSAHIERRRSIKI